MVGGKIGAEGGDLNYSITLITRNLLILHSAQKPKCPTIPLPLYVYCTVNGEKPYGMFFSSMLPSTV